MEILNFLLLYECYITDFSLSCYANTIEVLKILQETQKIVYNVIWAKKRHRLPTSILLANTQQEGLGTPSI